jgi:predicted membrane protein
MFDISHNRDRYFIGIVILIIGLIFLLNNIGILDIGFGSIWLPLLLIVIGLWQVIGGAHRRTFGPILLISLGLLWLLNNLGILEWSVLWPLLLILIGAWFLIKKTIHFPFKGKNISRDEINLFALFGGSETKVESQNFRGGNATAVFGGIDVDLREAGLAEGDPPQAEIVLTAIFGGAEVRVPENWSVIIKGTPILGGIEDARKRSTPKSSEVPPTLLVRAFVMFGGIEVR